MKIAGSVLTLALALSLQARPFWKHAPPPPPPPAPANYTTNVFSWWASVANAAVYRLNSSVGGGMTFGTNYVIAGVTNGSNYTVTVQAAISNQWSVPSCSVTFRAGSGITYDCPSSSQPVLSTTTPGLDTTMQ